ncbi:hypothetical protein YC2023_037946 [Brassica napus]|uniref:(rape) hypothetical protein n=1 Tax=Brassica napus TaxID=3708 RepID=A0A816I924_BRANA|nr:unnamed protein product [Brassica napus]
MGGGGGGDFRAKVWSMSGGPYCRPKHWRHNTAFAMLGVFLVCIPIAMKSAELEQMPHMPVRPIPSQIWCKNFGTKDVASIFNQLNGSRILPGTKIEKSL